MVVVATGVFLLPLTILVQKSDDCLGALVAWSTDGVPRKPVHGRRGAADAAVHDSAPTTCLLSFFLPLVLTPTTSPWPRVG
jgi:hypothetical protein